MTYTSGPFDPMLRACRGVVRTTPALSRFLVPYLVLDTLVCNAEHAKSIVEGLTVEIKAVLSAGCTPDLAPKQQQLPPTATYRQPLAQDSHMCIQVVLGLVDQLQAWASQYSACKTPPTPSSASSNQPSPLAPPAVPSHELGHIADWPNVVCSIKSLLSELPVDQLAEAAQRIGAHARAIRYLEQGARERHRQQRLGRQQQGVAKSSSLSTSILSVSALPHLQRNDGSNRELPQLTASEINSLMVAYASLEDTDALEGTISIRQLNGIELSPVERAVEQQRC